MENPAKTELQIREHYRLDRNKFSWKTKGNRIPAVMTEKGKKRVVTYENRKKNTTGK